MKWLKSLPFVFIGTVCLAGYYGGTLPNHGHTNAPGDGGPLANPVFTGTTTISVITSTTANIRNGNFQVLTATTATVINFTASSATITNLSVLSSETFTNPTFTGTISNLASGTYSGAIVFTSTNGVVITSSASAANITHLSLINNTNDNSSAQTKLLLQGRLNDNATLGIYTQYTDGLNSWSTGMIPGSNNNLLGNEYVVAFGTGMSGGGVTQFLLMQSSPNAKIVGILGNSGSAISTGLSGFVGQIASSSTAGNVTCVNNQYVDVAQITLDSGDWDISGNVELTASGGTVVGTQYVAFPGTVSGNSGTGELVGQNEAQLPTSPTTGSNVALILPNYRVLNPGVSTYYLKAFTAFTVNTPLAKGTIRARRMR